MTINSVITSLEEVRGLFLSAGLLKQENTSKSRERIVKSISEELRSVMYEDDYEKIYKTGLQFGDYFCILVDDSYLRFNAIKDNEKIKLNFYYYPNPRIYDSYEKFISDMGYEEFKGTEIALEEYDQYVSEAKLNGKILPIRYDYDESAHSIPGHAVSHIHFGLFEHVRIPVSKMLTPQAFSILIIRNLYYREWEKAHSNSAFEEIEKVHKLKCTVLDEEIFSEEEKNYLYLM